MPRMRSLGAGQSPSLHASDCSVDNSDIEEGSNIISSERGVPFRSTLLAHQRPGADSANRGRGMRSQIPGTLFGDNDEDEDQDDAITLSTQQSDSVMDAVPPHHATRSQRSAAAVNATQNFIPGVGSGQFRKPSGRAPADAMRIATDLNDHPSPSTAARYNRLRKLTQDAAVSGMGCQVESEESESVAESSGSDRTDGAEGNPFNNLRQSWANSTGNHKGFMKSPLSKRDAENTASKRPTLVPGWQAHLDELNYKGRKPGGRLQSPSFHRGKGIDAKDGGHRPRSLLQAKGHTKVPECDEPDANYEGKAYSTASQRKISSGSSKGKARSGTEASTSGETLVDRPHNAGLYASRLRLPSGQRMGSAIPSSGFSLPVDLSGVTMALESPIKTRLGVQHRDIVPEEVHAYAAATSHIQGRDLEAFASHIHMLDDKVEYVKDVANESLRKVKSLTRQSSLQEKVLQDHANLPKHFKSAYAQYDVNEDDDMAKYRADLQGAHHKVDEIGRTVESCRVMLADLRKQKDALLARESKRVHLSAATAPQAKAALQHSERAWKKGGTRAEDPSEYMQDGEDVELLRSQVNTVAREVERLRAIIDRQSTEKRVYPASSPIKPPSRHSAGVGGSGSVHGSENPFFTRRKVSGDSAARLSARPTTDNYQAELRASSPARPLPRDREVEVVRDEDGDAAAATAAGHRIFEGRKVEDDADDDGDRTALPRPSLARVNEGDVTQEADLRAERACEKVAHIATVDGVDGDCHDEQQCTHCARQVNNRHRQQARKNAAHRDGRTRSGKPRHSSSSWEDSDNEAKQARILLEEALLELETFVGASLPPALLQLANKQRALLEETIREEMDDFHHARKTYGDLADELKMFSPDISPANRRVLAEHVLVAVEGLEARATRIDRLRAALAAALPGNVVDDSDVRLRFASGSHARRPRRPRNSPPAVDQYDDNVYGGPRDGSYDAYRRVVSH